LEDGMHRRSLARVLSALGLVAATALAVPAVAPAAPAAPPRLAGYDASVQDASVAALAREFGLSQATATARLAAAPGLAALGERLRAQLGPDTAFWLDQASGRLVLNVTDARSAAVVRAAGATPRLVGHGMVELNAIVDELNAVGGPPGTSWGVDVQNAQVFLSLSDGVSASSSRLDALLSAASRHGDAVRFEHVEGTISYAMQGGDAISKSNGARCSAGFNVVPGWPGPYPPSGGNRVLTAGHCTSGFPTWYVGTATGPLLGATIGSSFPGNDFGVIRNDGTQPLPRTINLYNGGSQVISNSGDPYIGRALCKSGFKTGLTCGTVKALNVTVSNTQGTVTGLARSNACVLSGDSGGGWFEGTTAVGLTSASNLVCPNGNSYFQPVIEAMNAFNLFFPAS
jgi:streptogrisin D